MNGFLPDFEESGEGLLVLTHNTPACNGLISVQALLLAHLYTGPAFEESLLGKEDCDSACLRCDDFSGCSANCNMRWIREIMVMIQNNHYPATLADGS